MKKTDRIIQTAQQTPRGVANLAMNIGVSVSTMRNYINGKCSEKYRRLIDERLEKER